MHDPTTQSEPTRPRECTSQSFFAHWLARREWDRRGYELARGRIVRRPVRSAACLSVERRLHHRLAEAARRCDAVVLEPRQGFELPTGDTLLPDLAAVSATRWAAALPSVGDLLRVVPDLVVEVLPEWVQARDRGTVREIYERAGVREHWTVNVRTRTVTVCVAHKGGFELGWVAAGDDVLRCATLPNLQIDVATLF
jgi:Uma2 family endonuclease